MGGRPGYADEKPHGRFMNRSMGGFHHGPAGMLYCSVFDKNQIKIRDKLY